MVLALGGLVLAAVTATHLLLPSSAINRTISTLSLIAHALAFPLISGAALAVVTLIVVLVAIRSTRRGHRATAPLVGAVCFGLSGALVALSATSVALPVPSLASAEDGSDSFVVVSWNALDHFDGASARQIFDDLRADVAVFPELEERDAGAAGMSRIEQALTDGGLKSGDYDIFVSPPTGTHVAPLTVIVRKNFAGYTAVAEEQVTFGTVRLVPPSGSGLPEILALHTAPPLPRLMPVWAADLQKVSELAAAGNGEAIIVGDLNATLRHGSIGRLAGHSDALLRVPVLERGSWPTSAPRALRSSIDHILVPVETYAVVEARVVDIAGSDHAAVVATLTSGT